MPNKNILKHHDALRGKKTQPLLPRYRLRGHPEYVFAARLKKAPYWLVVSDDWWGMVDEEGFRADYIKSNDEARKMEEERSKTAPLESVK